MKKSGVILVNSSGVIPDWDENKVEIENGEIFGERSIFNIRNIHGEYYCVTPVPSSWGIQKRKSISEKINDINLEPLVPTHEDMWNLVKNSDEFIKGRIINSNGHVSVIGNISQNHRNNPSLQEVVIKYEGITIEYSSRPGHIIKSNESDFWRAIDIFKKFVLKNSSGKQDMESGYRKA